MLVTWIFCADACDSGLPHPPLPPSHLPFHVVVCLLVHEYTAVPPYSPRSQGVDAPWTWYVMDEFGSRIAHGEHPNVRVAPLYYVPSKARGTRLSFLALPPPPLR